MISINGVQITHPSKMSVSISDVDSPNTTRNAKGDLIRDRVGVKRKVELEFPPLKQAEMQVLLGQIQNVFFNVTYLDPLLGITTKTMYVGDRSVPLYRYGNGGSDILWENVKFNFVER